jgi:hypothetical protein
VRGSSESRLGRCSAETPAISPAATKTGHTCGSGCIALTTSTDTRPIRANSHLTAVRRRSRESAMTPPYSPQTIVGKNSPSPISPTARLVSVSCLICTGAAIRVMNDPIIVTAPLVNSSR